MTAVKSLSESPLIQSAEYLKAATASQRAGMVDVQATCSMACLRYFNDVWVYELEQREWRCVAKAGAVGPSPRGEHPR